MDRRIFLLLALSGCVSGCASLRSALTDAPVDVPKSTPEQAYNTGVMYLERGDSAAARREWDRCLAMSAPGSGANMDCALALEKLASPAALEL
jgi:hypothetical protein